MQSVTIRLEKETIEEIDDEAEEYKNRSEYLREVIEDRHKLRDLRRENQRLQNQIRTLIQDREEKTELVEYVEEEKTELEKRKEIKKKPAWRRAKTWLLGRE